MLIGLMPLPGSPLSFLGLGVGLMVLMLPIGVVVILMLEP